MCSDFRYGGLPTTASKPEGPSLSESAKISGNKRFQRPSALPASFPTSASPTRNPSPSDAVVSAPFNVRNRSDTRANSTAKGFTSTPWRQRAATCRRAQSISWFGFSVLTPCRSACRSRAPTSSHARYSTTLVRKFPHPIAGSSTSSSKTRSATVPANSAPAVSFSTSAVISDTSGPNVVSTTCSTTDSGV